MYKRFKYKLKSVNTTFGIRLSAIGIDFMVSNFPYRVLYLSKQEVITRKFHRLFI